MKINLETQKLSELSPEEALKSNQAAVSFQFNDHKQNSKNVYNFHTKLDFLKFICSGMFTVCQVKIYRKQCDIPRM